MGPGDEQDARGFRDLAALATPHEQLLTDRLVAMLAPLLDPSVIYVRFVAALQNAGVRPRYAVHITGHGWRKLMRLNEPFVYRVTKLPPTPPAPMHARASTRISANCRTASTAASIPR